MHITAAILTALVTMAMASPMPDEPTKTLQMRQTQAGEICDCHPTCGCDGGAFCFCEKDTLINELAPCHPNCGCDDGLVGICECG